MKKYLNWWLYDSHIGVAYIIWLIFIIIINFVLYAILEIEILSILDKVIALILIQGVVGLIITAELRINRD